MTRGVDLLGKSQDLVVIILSCLLLSGLFHVQTSGPRPSSTVQSRAEAEPCRPPPVDRTRVASCKGTYRGPGLFRAPAGIFLTAVSQRHFHSRRVDLSLVALPWGISPQWVVISIPFDIEVAHFSYLWRKSTDCTGEAHGSPSAEPLASLVGTVTYTSLFVVFTLIRNLSLSLDLSLVSTLAATWILKTTTSPGLLAHKPVS